MLSAYLRRHWPEDPAGSLVFRRPQQELRELWCDIDTVRRSESRAMESPTRDLSYTVGASANRFVNDRLANDKHDTEVDDLFAPWDSDPLGLLSLLDLGM